MDDSRNSNGSMNKQSLENKAQVACPYCSSVDTEFFSLFGQQLLTMQYYCNACHTPFEYVKDDAVLRDGGAAFNSSS